MGWPFLVASGRRRDYSILLAPDFLVADLDYGIIEEVVSPASERDPAKVIQVETRASRRLTLAYATHLLTHADIAETLAPTGPSTASPRDEHNRPLRLIYGFVSPNGWIPEPDQADLDAARKTALGVYQRFLQDEEKFTVVPARPFPIRSRVTVQPTAATILTGRAASPHAVPVSTARPSREEIGIRRHTAVWLAGAASIASLALIAAIWGTSPPTPPPPACPTVAAVASTRPSTPMPSIAPSSSCTPTPEKTN
jgi:hypothetical protein